MDCTPKPFPRHTVVPDKGDAGDSSGYIGFSPEPGEPLRWRYRFPYRGVLSLVDFDSLDPEQIRFRIAATGAELQQTAFQVLSGSVEIASRTTIELELVTEQEGAAATFKYQKLGPTL